MVDSNGNVKLLDFSTAKILGENGFVEEGTDKFFNPFQCSPEQMFQREYYLNSDVWMLGTVFLELMYPGEPLIYEFDENLLGSNWQWRAIIEQIEFSYETKQPFKSVPAMYGQDLTDLISWMLDYDPTTRPSMGQVAERIKTLNAEYYLERDIFSLESQECVLEQELPLDLNVNSHALECYMPGPASFLPFAGQHQIM